MNRFTAYAKVEGGGRLPKPGVHPYELIEVPNDLLFVQVLPNPRATERHKQIGGQQMTFVKALRAEDAVGAIFLLQQDAVDNIPSEFPTLRAEAALRDRLRVRARDGRSIELFRIEFTRPSTSEAMLALAENEVR